MRVEVNSELCQGHNRCYVLAPELFDVDDYGNAVVIGDGVVAAGLEDKARLAVANCPEYAITIAGEGVPA
jgi:ferredoxin